MIKGTGGSVHGTSVERVNQVLDDVPASRTSSITYSINTVVVPTVRVAKRKALRPQHADHSYTSLLSIIG